MTRNNHVRFYVKNPGGAYDPAPLHAFEDIDFPNVLPGDTICEWSKSSGEAEGRNHYYKVLERMFRADTNGFDVFVLVEEVEPGWTAGFD